MSQLKRHPNLGERAAALADGERLGEVDGDADGETLGDVDGEVLEDIEAEEEAMVEPPQIEPE